MAFTVTSPAVRTVTFSCTNFWNPVAVDGDAVGAGLHEIEEVVSGVVRLPGLIDPGVDVFQDNTGAHDSRLARVDDDALNPGAKILCRGRSHQHRHNAQNERSG